MDRRQRLRAVALLLLYATMNRAQQHVLFPPYMMREWEEINIPPSLALLPPPPPKTISQWMEVSSHSQYSVSTHKVHRPGVGAKHPHDTTEFYDVGHTWRVQLMKAL